MDQQREAEAMGGGRANRHHRPPGGRAARDAGIDLFGDGGGRIRDMERIYRILEQGRPGEYQYEEDKFTLDDAFLFVEENIHNTKDEL